MKRTAYTILSILLLLIFAPDAHSTIASPQPFKYKQPDGSTVIVQLHGDEFFHWETIGGKNVALDHKGYYREESKASLQARQISAINDMMNRRAMYSAQPNKVIREGEPHFLILLIEFTDIRFTVPDPQTAFSNLLNEKGYSANGATGSVKDYYLDNSCGKFDPVFDVVRPVQVSRSCSYYGANNDNARYALQEACLLVDDEVDFSKYDGDNDGIVDNVFFFFAGHNEAEGGGSWTIWPHSWNIYDFNCICDGVRISQYACTSEYKGPSGNEMCGIGTFCHEFGHTLGLPDLYDIDYGTSGQAFTMSYYSLMCSGNYNNGGKTPPFLLGLERMLLGWLDGPEIWTDKGQKIVEPVSYNKSYRTRTTTDGEWFIFETRNGKSWDSPVPAGLIVTHMDQSDRYVHGMTAKERWDNWQINNCGDHPCCYIVTAGDGEIDSYPFPGSMEVTEFTLGGNPSFRDWEGKSTGFEIHSIQFDGERTSLYLSSDKEPQDISEMGYNYIVLSDSEYKAGDELELMLKTGTNPPASVTWIFDGEAQNEGKVILSPGTHEIKAVLSFDDKSTETIYAEIYAE